MGLGSQRPRLPLFVELVMVLVRRGGGRSSRSLYPASRPNRSEDIVQYNTERKCFTRMIRLISPLRFIFFSFHVRFFFTMTAKPSPSSFPTIHTPTQGTCLPKLRSNKRKVSYLRKNEAITTVPYPTLPCQSKSIQPNTGQPNTVQTIELRNERRLSRREEDALP